MTKIIAKANFNTNNSNLFVLIGANRFSYFISTEDKKVVIQESQVVDEKPLASVIKKDLSLNNKFGEVKVGFYSPYTTLVPDIIYKEKDATSYLENSFRIPHQHYLLTDNLSSLQCQNVFLAPIEIYNLFQNKFSNVKYFHVTTTLLVAWQEKATQLQTPSIYINVIGNQFQIGAFDKKRLLLSNTYEFKTAKDFIYFTLLTFDQLDLNVEKTPLFLSGEVMKASEIYNLLYRYIRDINFMERTPAFTFDAAFNQQANHFNFDLYSFHLL
ncbi:MAG: DUF3822 family protein [Saprospiraceae bacterium]